MGLFNLRPQRVSIGYAQTPEDFRELVVLDATLNEGHKFGGKVTQHAVEDGGTISDHVVLTPATLSLTGIVSDNPIRAIDSAAGMAAGLLGGAIGGVAGAVATGITALVGNELLQDADKKSKVAWEIFQTINLQRIPVSIITGLNVYNNMVLETFTVDRTNKTSNALQFTATFKQVSIATSERVEVPADAIAEDVKPGGEAEGQLGAQETGELSGAAERRATILFNLIGG